MLLEGLFIPLTTPFYSDGRLNVRKLEHNVERYSRTPAAGLALLTPSGETDLLSDAERLTVLRTAVEIAAKDKVLLADCTHPGVAQTLDLLSAAAELGFDAAVLRSPVALAALPTGNPAAVRRTWFEAVADRSPLPLILIDGPAPEHWLAPDLLASLATSAQVLGWVCAGDANRRIPPVLESTRLVSREVTVTPVFAVATGRMLAEVVPVASGNYIAAASLTGTATALATEPPRPAIRTRTKRVGFQILAGQTSALSEALTAGARGALLPFAACAPQACYEALAAWKDGDEALAAEKSDRLRSAALLIEEQLGPPALKAGCDLNGYFGGRARLPLLLLHGDQQAEIATLLRPMRS